MVQHGKDVFVLHFCLWSSAILAACTAPPSETEPIPGRETSSGTAPKTPVAPSEDAVAFQTVEQGAHSRYDPPNFTAYSLWEEDAWATFWSNHTDPYPATSDPPPSVNFSTHFIVAIFMGTKNTGGYAIEIQNVSWNGSAHRVGYATHSPGANCVTPMVVTQPYHFVQVQRKSEGTPVVSYALEKASVAPCE